MKIKVFIRTDKVGSKCESVVDVPEWGEMDASEREEFCKEIAFNMGEWGFEELE